MAEEEEKEEQTASPKKSNPLILIIIIVVLVLILLIGAVIVFLSMDSGDGGAQQAQNRAVQERQAAGQSMMPSSILEVGPMFPLDNFTVNLLSDSGRRYLKVEMNLELSDEEVGAELDNKTAVVRDIIIRLLSSKSLEEISTAKGKEKLKEQIVDQLNLRLKDGRVNNVYFTEFVVQ